MNPPAPIKKFQLPIGEAKEEVKPPKTVAGTCCAVVGCFNELPIVGHQHGDPYCSTFCAKKAYGTLHLFQNFTHDTKGRPIKYANS